MFLALVVEVLEVLFVVVLVMFVLVARSSFRDSAGALCGGAGRGYASLVFVKYTSITVF